ncbi:MAG TPA: Rnase Y domain-containing protein, partial [Verrucomicrobiota bacterium]|nr:Rnase Y domain-containing protein [Verrucomicrobiota bacterium]
MDDIWVILAFFILISTCLFVWLRWQQKSLRFEKERMLMDAKSRADEYFLEGQKRLDELSKVKDELYDQKEQSLAHREALIGLQLQGIVEREANIKENATRLSKQEQQVIATQQEVNRMQTQWSERIAQIAGFTAQEARNALMSHIEKEAAADACKLSRRILDSAQSSAQEEAQRIIAIAIQRCAITHSFESDSAVIQLPSDDIKGRIIGREGRNIKTFENLTGITV